MNRPQSASEVIASFWEYITGPKDSGPCVICGGITEENIRGRDGRFEFVHGYWEDDSVGCREVWHYRRERDSMQDEATERDYYHDYASYIASNEWRTKADVLKRKAGFTCAECGRRATRTELHVHHKHYRTLYKERRKDLAVLCSVCHKDTHIKCK